MKLKSKDTINPRDGVARNWRFGNVAVEWYVERPPQSWLRFDSNFSVRWYSTKSEGANHDE